MATKRAVVVGINYVGTPNQLSGCVNDATDWLRLLRAEGYADVKFLADGQATKAAIVQALRDSIAQMKWGDRLVFTYSGHGTWIPDRDGDEADRRDEALCPVDFQTAGVLTDDELQQIFSYTPAGTGALILSDSCHSGSVSRFAGSLTGAVPPGVPRFVSPATFLDSMSEERAVELETRVDPAAPRKTASLVSGCGDTEYSYDAWYGTRANGAMTRNAIDSYRTGMSLNTWFKALRTRLPSSDYPQSPQLTPASLYRKYSRAL